MCEHQAMSNDAPYDYAAAAEEGAKAVQRVTDVARDLGGYLATVSQGLPETVFGIINDRLKLFRAERAIGYYSRLRTTITAAKFDLSKLRPPSPSIEIPLLEAATLEDREELQDLWDRLLAAAILPSTRNRVRARHVEILKRLEPFDALLLENFANIAAEPTVSNPDAFIETARKVLLSVSKDEIHISFFALVELGLVDTGTDIAKDMQRHAPILSAQGREFLFLVRRQV